MKLLNILTLLITIFFTTNSSAQQVDADHKLMWEISAKNLEQPSYLYGTMHIRDPRVFNFSDSVYLKIEACKHFALEVHPDTLIKTMIVDPFNSSINRHYADLYETEDLDEINDELREKTGIDLSGLSQDNFDLIPFLLDKLFKKNKDKETFLDAHLYHIARLLDRNIVGLETIEQHKTSVRSLTGGKGPNLKEILKRKKQRKVVLEKMIQIYEAGKVDELFEYGSYGLDTVLAYRNNVMVNSSIPYIEDGGLFMAVGAAHLSGENGVITLLRRKGFKVVPVKATFSNEIINAELAQKELDWIVASYPEEGFSVSLPDHAFEYRPESIGGVITVRSYPDLGLGHLFFYSATPVMVKDYTLEDMEEEALGNIKKISKNFSAKHNEYDGSPMLQVSFTVNGAPTLYRYIMKNNMLYTFGLSKLSKKGELNATVAKRFFKSVEFSEIKLKKNKLFTDTKGAFSVKSNLPTQKYDQEDNSTGVKFKSEHVNFLDQQSRLLHMVLYSYYEGGSVIDNANTLFDDYKSSFESEGDSLIYSKEDQKFGGTEILIEYEDKTFLHGLGFVRGNRMYQILSTGSTSTENIQKSVKFIENFELLDYLDFKFEKFDHENFTTYFPRAPKIDTITTSYSLGEFAKKALYYTSMDEATGLNVIVYENQVSPYATYENIDTCFNRFNEIFVNYNDTLIYSNKILTGNAPKFNFCSRSSVNQLQYNFDIIFDDDKVYEVYLIQDTAAVNQKAMNQFLENFQLKKRTKKSILFRDSTEVKNLVIKDVFDKDTLIMEAAANKLYGFNFTDQESARILNLYDQNFNLDQPISYHKNLIQVISNNEVPNYPSVLKKIYMNKKIDDELRLEILRPLIKQADDTTIALTKELLQHHMPSSIDNWEVTGIMYPMYENIEKIEPLFPELLEFGTTDSTIILDYLFHHCLEENVIDYETLAPIHGLIDSICQKNFQKVKADPDESRYDLLTATGIASFDKKNNTTIEIAAFFFQDTSSYFKLESAKILLRQGEEPDLSNIYEEFSEYNSIVKMYELERLFDGVKILPDSMQNLAQYAKVVATAYPEEDEYFENPTIKIIENYQDNEHEHFFIECNWQYDNDDEIQKLLMYTVMDIQSGEFVIPKYQDTYTDYRYWEEGTYEEVKKGLIEYYEENRD